MKNREQIAEQYAEGKSSSSVFRETHKRDFLAGYETATPKWISVENPPKFNEPVLIKYIKGKQGEVVTQGYYQDEAQSIADRSLKSAETSGKFSKNGVETAEFWRKHGYGLTWFDYSGRQIQNLVAKGSKNKVIYYMEIPQ